MRRAVKGRELSIILFTRTWQPLPTIPKCWALPTAILFSYSWARFRSSSEA